MARSKTPRRTSSRSNSAVTSESSQAGAPPDLRSGTPVWIGRAAPIKLAPLKSDQHADVLVLGGGITGALIAHELVQHGASVLLVDRREIGLGSTAASTGLLQYEVDTPLIDLIGKVGEQNAVRAYRLGLQAIDRIEQLVADLNDPCGFSRRDSIYFASHAWHKPRLEREYACRRQFGFDIDFLTPMQLLDISSIEAAGATRSRGDGQINPFRFTQKLIAAAIKGGLRAHDMTHIVDIRERASEVIAHANGCTLRATAIVYATGYESAPYLEHPRGKMHSTYAVASQKNLVVPGWPKNALLWETARPYFYGRRTADRRVLIGGEDTAFSNDHRRDSLVERKVEKLLKRFARLFPGARFEPEFRWAGTFAETKDGLAYIGQPPGRPRAYFALGYGGNGITFSAIAARIICDLFLGRRNDDAKIFRFGR